MRQKHPRLRGEDSIPRNASRLPAETPPLTRGRRKLVSVSITRRGNTPAYAGKTEPLNDKSILFEKHPRLRGEDVGISEKFFTAQETPPLTRGRLYLVIPMCQQQRNTPAYAGKTQKPLGFGIAHAGNTPAYAGKTNECEQAPCNARKHPRLRGEDDPTSFARAIVKETPPLTRGRPLASGRSR